MIVVRRGRPRSAASRGLTLLEILVALAILLAVAGLVVPTYLESLNRRAFESAEQMLVNQFILARAHAQMTGRAVEVRYEPGARLIRARLFDPQEMQTRLNSFDPDGDVPGAGLTAGEGHVGRGDPFGSNNADLDIAEPWAVRRLRNGIRLTRQQPAFNESGREPAYGIDDDLFEMSADEWGGETEAPSFGAGDSDESYRLAVFVPDGSALLSRPIWITDERSRAARIEINPWTGMARLHRSGGAASFTEMDPADEFLPAEPAERGGGGRSVGDSTGAAGRPTQRRAE